MDTEKLTNNIGYVGIGMLDYQVSIGIIPVIRDTYFFGVLLVVQT